MIDVDDDTEDTLVSPKSPDAAMKANAPPGGYKPHPLFPREDDGPEDRDIQFVSFRRRRSDGRTDNCAEDIPAGEIQSWADVTGPWGGGGYKAVAKDKDHRILAWYPKRPGQWMLFEQESKPFAPRGASYRPSARVAAPPPTGAPTASPPVAQSPIAPTPHPLDAAFTELVCELFIVGKAALAGLRASLGGQTPKGAASRAGQRRRPSKARSQ